MELNKIWNESNEVTMKEHIDMNSVDLILTSPPYNNCRDNAERTNDKPFINAIGESIGIRGWHKKYDVYEDQKTTQEYCDWIVSLFNQFDMILKENGVILWNTSYQNENNDEVCAYNHATFSTEFCRKIMNIYVPEETVVYDPFMGSGTTGLACKQSNRYYIGSEISKNQCEWAENRIKNGKYIDETRSKNQLF